MPRSADPTSVLVVRRMIEATPERLFELWTSPKHLRLWWGPAEVRCTAAEIDLRVGGTYRLANEFPDGRVVWISGQFLRIEQPHELAYTWCVGASQNQPEQVTVKFERRGTNTEVVVTHERIRSAEDRRGHELGWIGCLEGLARHSAALPSP